MRGSKEEWEWEWTYKTAEMPQNVVKCSDKHKEGCYLGVSFYSDGICEESVGVITSNRSLIHMAIDGDYHSCPYFMYLTTKKGTVV